MPKKLNLKSPEPPSHLSPSSCDLWRWVVKEFELEPHDFELLRLACEHLDAAEACREIVAKEGPVYTDRFGSPRNYPCVGQFRDHSLAAARLLRELRLSNLPAENGGLPRLDERGDQ